MTLEIKTEIRIKANQEKVWEILTNFSDYPNWNPFITSLKGNVELGNKIVARIELPNGQAMTFRPKILTLVKNQELSWLGHLLFPGLFDGNHKFELIHNGNETVFIQSEKFSGILVSFFKKQLNINTRNGFMQMNEKLKELAEKV